MKKCSLKKAAAVFCGMSLTLAMPVSVLAGDVTGKDIKETAGAKGESAETAANAEKAQNAYTERTDIYSSAAGGVKNDTTTGSVLSFKDVQKPGQYFYEPVYWGVRRGIVKGTSETTFSPSAGVTRGQFVTFLYRASGSPEVKSITQKFRDLPAREEFRKAISWAASNDITAGTTEVTFAPGRTITREEAVTFLYRYGKAKPGAKPDELNAAGAADTSVKSGTNVQNKRKSTTGKENKAENTTTTGSAASTGTQAKSENATQHTSAQRHENSDTDTKVTGISFQDVKSGAYYANAVRWCAGRDIVEGYTAEWFGVGDTCSRGAGITYIYRMLKNL